MPFGSFKPTPPEYDPVPPYDLDEDLEAGRASRAGASQQQQQPLNSANDNDHDETAAIAASAQESACDDENNNANATETEPECCARHRNGKLTEKQCCAFGLVYFVIAMVFVTVMVNSVAHAVASKDKKH